MLYSFVMSDFGAGPVTTGSIDLFSCEQLPIRQALQQAAKDHADFEWTAFYPGQFMNYLCYDNENEAAVGMDHSLMWDGEHKAKWYRYEKYADLTQ